MYPYEDALSETVITVFSKKVKRTFLPTKPYSGSFIPYYRFSLTVITNLDKPIEMKVNVSRSCGDFFF